MKMLKPTQLQKQCLKKHLIQTRSQATASVSSQYETAKPYKDMPSPRGYPIIKNLLDLLSKEKGKHFTSIHTKLVKQLGDTYKFRMPGGMDVVFLANPADGRTLLKNDGPAPNIPIFSVVERARGGLLKHVFPSKGLVAQGEEWMKFRGAVQQDMMRPKSALFYIDDLSSIIDEVIEKMEANMNAEREVQNFNFLMMEFALESVGLMFIGARLGVLHGAPDGKVMIENARNVFDLLLPLTVVPPAVVEYTPMFKDFARSVRIMYEIGDKNIKAAKAKHELDGSLTGTILKRLIDRCGPDSPIPTVMAADAMSAGIDTTGNASTLLLHHLAINPEKQDILYEEIVRVVGKNGMMTEEKLSDMRYLKACQQESMRMVPIAHTTARQTQVNMVLGGYQVPKDTLVIRHNGVVSNDEAYYKQADKFIPERWLRGCPAYEKVDPYTNLPFGHGPRSCVGQRFARLELYMLAFKLVQRYKIECDGLPVEIDYTGLSKAVNDVNIKLTPRN